MHIAIYTSHEHLRGGMLFSGERRPGSYPAMPFQVLRQVLQAAGCRVLTFDQIEDPARLDFVLMLDLPSKPKEVEEVRRASPRALVILYILESPSNYPGQFNPRNHKLFDAVITYNPHVRDLANYFYCSIPCDLCRHSQLLERTWHQRRWLAVVNSRKQAGLLCDAGRGPLHRLGVRGLGESWHCSWPEILGQWRGYRYSHRNRWVTWMDAHCPPNLDFDVYGLGWQGESPCGYWERWVRNPSSLASARGCFDGDKLNLLAGYRYSLVVENWIGSEGYISEKVYETIQVGCIPIYWGDQTIADRLPADCYIDGSHFTHPHQLLRFLSQETPERWSQRQKACRIFLQSPAFRAVKPQGYAERIQEILITLHAARK